MSPFTSFMSFVKTADWSTWDGNILYHPTSKAYVSVNPRDGSVWYTPTGWDADLGSVNFGRYAEVIRASWDKARYS